MQNIPKLVLFIFLGVYATCTPRLEENMPNGKLNPEEERVIVQKKTELPFSGKYHDFSEKGTFVCKRCGAALYYSSAKFDSGCGWPSFDEEIPGAVKRQADADGLRTEIACSVCGAHLGHVFLGEGFTATNTRHCVNSITMNFIPDDAARTETAVFASGCFWGTQFYLQQATGVLSTTVGFTGGNTVNPSYEEVCNGTTGHAEAVQVIFDPALTTYEKLTKLFFETHDFTQVNRQGPDIGEQYRSEIFYTDDAQKKSAEKLIAILGGKGFHVATRLTRAGAFWKAETHHQSYYQKTASSPPVTSTAKFFKTRTPAGQDKG